MKIKMNRRGDIPVTILVLLVVLICILAITSFIFSNQSIQNSFVGPGLVTTVVSFADQMSFYGNTGVSAPWTRNFDANGVNITVNGGVIEGTYSQRGFFGRIVGLGPESTVVKVTYQR